jgi:hypothetical protein
MRRRLAVAVAALIALPVAAFAAEPSPALKRMKRDVTYLASEKLEGRGVETEGIKKAGAYIAAAFREAGLRPGGKDGTYFQPFTVPIGRPHLAAPNTLALTGPNGKRLALKSGTSFTPTALTASGKLSAGLVFVGYGITTSHPAYDDYAGADVKGKWVVILRRTPRTEQEKNPFDDSLAALSTKVENAAEHGAVGVIFVNDASFGKDGDPLMKFDYRAGDPADFPVLHLKRSVLGQLLAAEGEKLSAIEKQIDASLKPHTVALAGWTATAEVSVERPSVPTRNVIGVAEGSGPLADETVVIGAHYDHVGRGEIGSMGGKAAKGKIHYGADDNASGTTGLMELARRIGAMKDRVGRRIVFVAFSGEERGLYGSKYYVKHPIFPLTKTALMLNMDMIGRVVEVADEAAFKKVLGVAAIAGPSGPVVPALRDRVVVYGTGTAPGLADLVDVVNRSLHFKLLKVPGGRGPSDHDSFYRKRVPVLFFFSGTHRDYHRPSDTADKINVAGMKKVTDMVEALALHFATAPDRPKYLVTSGGWSDPTDDSPRVSRPAAPKLGIMPGNYEAKEGGLLVEEVSPGGAAEKGGVKARDVIIEIAGRPVKNIQTYMTAMAAQKAGRPIDVVVLRKDKRVTVKLVPQP